MCMWIEEFAKTCEMGVGYVGGVYIYMGQKSSLRLVGWVQGMKEVYIYMCMWIEEFAKTCGMGVGDEGGVYICVCGQKNSLRLVGWVQGMKEVYIYVYVDRRVR